MRVGKLAGQLAWASAPLVACRRSPRRRRRARRAAAPRRRARAPGAGAAHHAASLLDAGVEVFATRGYHAARVDDIVKRGQDLARHLLPVLREQGRAVPGAGRGGRRRDARRSPTRSRPSHPTATGTTALRELARRASPTCTSTTAPVIRAWTEAEIGGERVRPARAPTCSPSSPASSSTGSGTRRARRPRPADRGARARRDDRALQLLRALATRCEVVGEGDARHAGRR